MRLVLAIFVLAATVACQGIHPPAKMGTFTDIQGKFLSEQPVGAGTLPKEQACDPVAKQIDPRLKPGMIFETSYRSFNGTKPTKSIVVRATISKVESCNLEEKLVAVAAWGLNVHADLGLDEPFTCPGKNGDSCSKPVFLELMDPYRDGEFSNCTVTPDELNPQIDNEASTGKLQLVSGQTLDVLKTTRTVHGKLTCNGHDLGAGEETDIEIKSSDIPAEGSLNACGGTIVYKASVIKNHLGTTLVGRSEERTLVP